MPDCSESEAECDGFWVDGQCFGGTASMDNCHICSGGGTGNIPDATDLGCGCGVGAAQLHYYDQDGDRVPNEPYSPYAPIDYCAVRNGNCNPGDTNADGEPICINGENAFWNPGITQTPLVPCPNPTLADDGEPIECYTCGNIGGWCTYDSNNPLPGGNPWDIMPGCPCNKRQCGTGDCCVDLAGGGECEGHAQSRGLGLDNDDFWPQCLPDDACGNCGGGCVCSGTMDYPGGTCVGGDITCGDPIPPGENTLTVGCGQTCMENPPQNDHCGDCGGTCFNPVDYGEEQPEGCKECGCDSVAELHCDAGDADCNTNSYVGSVIPGAYCSCTGEMVDCCGNCGGGCLSAGGDCVSNPPDDIIMCDDDDNNINLADCFGVCVNNGGDLTCYDTINECSDDIGTDSCGICHGQGPIYSCADNWNDAGAGGSGPCPGSTPNEGFQLCFHELDGCTAPDECGNCGGDCQDLGDGYIQCGSSSNNDVVADCKGICGGDATYDNCGFCDGPYIDGIGADCNTANDVNGDDGPIIYCAVPDDPAHQYYCPICTEEDGTCGDDSNDLYGVYNGGACGELNLCGECVVNGHGTNPSGSTIGYVLSDGEPCQGSSENHPHQGEICGCPRDDGYQVAVCDDCGFCYPPDHPDFNSKCTGCPDEVESCQGISNGGDYLPCNGNLNSANESCQYWDSNECTINGGNCFCPLGITECYQDSDGDGDYNLPVDIDLECNGTGRYECNTTPLCSSCNSADGECCTSPEGDEICDIPCSSIQTFSTGCMDNFTPSTGGPFTAPGSNDGYGDGACNYNFYADPEGSGACEDMGNIDHEHNIEPCCSYPGDPGFTCPDWGFDCIPTLKNTGAYSGVTQCTPGTCLLYTSPRPRARG